MINLHEEFHLFLIWLIASYLNCFASSSVAHLGEHSGVKCAYLESDNITHNSRKSDDVGYFWQLTDIHYDPNYTDPKHLASSCSFPSGQQHDIHRDVGDFFCDSPWPLVQSALDTMRAIEPSPDFILWTGDTSAHIPVEKSSLQGVFTLMYNTTRFLQRLYPNTIVLPSIGNHDVWPNSQVQPGPHAYYTDVLTKAGWDSMLNLLQRQQFLQGGFYASVVRPGLRLIALNTILWFKKDRSTDPGGDPSNQFAWLEQQLKNATNNHEKVIITGHVPPGSPPRSWNDEFWLHPHHNARLIELLSEYHGCIMAALFAHEHTDTFRLIKSSGSSKVVVPVLLTPALTPLFNNVNPSIRLYSYSRRTNSLLGYKQFYLDLAKVKLHDVKPCWQLLYQSDEEDGYRLSSLNARSLANLSARIEMDDKLFEAYYSRFTTGHDVGPCNVTCRWRHLCSIKHVDYESYFYCLQEHADLLEKVEAGGDELDKKHHKNHHKHHVQHFMYLIVYTLAVIACILMIIVIAQCCFRSNVSYFTQPRYVLIS